MKKISIVLCISMILSMFTFVSVIAAERAVSYEHDAYFETFKDYTGPLKTAPANFEKIKNTGNVYTMDRVNAATDSDTGSTVVQLGDNNNVGGIQYFTDADYENGVRRISFDAKVSDGGNLGIYGIRTANGNPYDIWKLDGSGALVTNENTYVWLDKTGVYKNSWTTDEDKRLSENDTNWHKYEVVHYIQDDGQTRWEVYRDGEKVNSWYFAERVTAIGLKGSKTPVYIDNFASYHDEVSAIDAAPTRLCAEPTDDALAVNTAANIRLHFSQALDTSSFSPSDFKLTKTTGGSPVNPTSVTSVTGTTVQLGLPALTEGKYKIEYVGSGKSLSAQNGGFEATYIDVVNETPITDLEAARYYYMNEDFEGYEGGRPASWTSLGAASYAQDNYNKTIKADGKDGGSSMKLSSGLNQKYYYRFDEAITGGEFTVEFDMKTSGKGWSVGLVHAAAYSEADLNNNIIFGNYYKEENDWCVAGGHTSWEMTEAKGQLTLNEWVHVKIDVNLIDHYNLVKVGDAAPVRVDHAGGAAGLTNVGGTQGYAYSMRRQQKKNGETPTVTDASMFVTGVNGIKFVNNDGDNTSADVCFDNIKIYKEDSLNLNETFDGWSKATDATHTTSAATPVGWYQPDSPTDPKTMSSPMEGKDYHSETAADDKAMKISVRDGGEKEYVRLLDHPIEPGTPFAVEFDMKVSNLSTTLRLGLQSSWDMHRRPTNVSNGDLYYSTGEQLDNTDNKDSHWYNQCDAVTFGTNTNGYWSFSASGFTNWDNGETVGTINTVDTWRHVKFEVIPNTTSNATIKLYLDDDATVDGTLTTTRDFVSKTIGNNRPNDISALKFKVYNAVGEYFALDNLKVYELNPITAPYVTYAEAEYYDGTSAVLSSEAVNNISANTKRLAIHFSQPLNETTESMKNKVNVKYSAHTDNNAGYTLEGELSEDKQTYYISFKNASYPDPAKASALSIGLEQSIKGETELAQLKSPYTYYIRLGNDGGFKVSDFNLYKKIAGQVWSESNEVQSPDVWVRTGEYTPGEPAANYKLIAKGYNTGADMDYICLPAVYDVDPVTGIKTLNSATIPIDAASAKYSGEFEYDLSGSLPNVSENQTFKAFLWNNANYKPLSGFVGK